MKISEKMSRVLKNEEFFSIINPYYVKANQSSFGAAKNLSGEQNEKRKNI